MSVHALTIPFRYRYLMICLQRAPLYVSMTCPSLKWIISLKYADIRNDRLRTNITVMFVYIRRGPTVLSNEMWFNVVHSKESC